MKKLISIAVADNSIGGSGEWSKGFFSNCFYSGQTSDVVNVNTLIVKIYQSGASIVSQPVVK